VKETQEWWRQRRQRQEQGTMISGDSEDDEEPPIVSRQEGETAARQIEAVAYLEWTEYTPELRSEMERLMWYGYYNQLSKSKSNLSIYLHG
jgi:hypothetical protein